MKTTWTAGLHAGLAVLVTAGGGSPSGPFPRLTFPATNSTHMKTKPYHSIYVLLLALTLNLGPVCRTQAQFIQVGSMTTERYFHTATLLPNDLVLVAGGYNGSTGDYTAAAELYNPTSGTWTLTGSLSNAREYHTATFLPNGKVLVAGGIGSSGLLSSAELYDPVTGTWTPTGSMHESRYTHTATLLTNGMVLVAGGSGDTSAELYNPTTGTWSFTGSMNTARNDHTATLLPNGKVLAAGGGSDSTSAELYDPVAGTWTATGPLNVGRNDHTATLLPNGTVLVAGGLGKTSYLASVEIYNPSSGSWSVANPMINAREDPTATLLPNGTLLVTGGGANGGPLSAAESYNPNTGIWTASGALNNARELHTATLMADGRVLMSGGLGTETVLASAELYDASSAAWTTTSALISAHSSAPYATFTATLLPNGKVLIAGGDNGSGYLTGSELFNPASGTWAPTGPLNQARGNHAAVLLGTGKVLVVGGYIAAGSSAELYDPNTGNWTLTGSLNNGRANFAATLLPNGEVLVEGGYDGGVVNSSAELYNPANGQWSLTGSLNSVREYHTATLLPNGKVLVAGGDNGFDEVPAAELYDPTTGMWTSTGSLNEVRGNHTATLLPNGEVLIAGGFNGQNQSLPSSAEVYNPTTGTWTVTGSLNVARTGHSATLLPNGKVLVAGGGNFSDSFSSTELYDPASGGWTLTAAFNTARENHTATLLPNGEVLAAGGYNENTSSGLSSAELYNIGLGFNAFWQPQIATVSSPLNLGASLTMSGTGFRGISEASCGDTQDSSADYPVVQLRSVDSGQTLYALASAVTNWSATSFTSVPLPLNAFPAGYALATVFVNGIPSPSVVTLVGVPLLITNQSSSQAVLFGGNATFSVGVTGQSPITYQWLLNGNLLAGDHSPTLTITNAQATNNGNYQVVVTDSFGSITSVVATLTVSGLIIVPGPQVSITAPTNVLNLQAVTAESSAKLSYQWSKQSGVDQVSITAPNASQTSVVFGFAGTNVISVTATDGTNTFQGQVTVAANFQPDFPADTYTASIFQDVSDLINGPLLNNGNVFLTRFPSTSSDAANYYAAIDPTSAKTTLAAWKVANGISTNQIPPASTNSMNGVVAATYFNCLDLGFGRRMIMLGTNGGNWAYSVSNFRSLQDAINNSNKIATVTMDYSSVSPGTARFTKFYVFDSNDNRTSSADLDGGGQKFVPGLCVDCHGGTTGSVSPGVGDVHAHFLAFDLLNALDYSTTSNLTRAAQEPAFKLLNQGVLAIEQDIAQNDSGHFSPAITNLIEGWYGSGLTNASENDYFVPAGWQTPGLTGISVAAQSYFYRTVIATSCRSCHETRDVSQPAGLDFSSFANWHAWSPNGPNSDPVVTDVFATNSIFSLGPPGGPYVVSPSATITMPHARRTFQRFWSSLAPPEPDSLSYFLGGGTDGGPSVAPAITSYQKVGTSLVITFTTTLGESYNIEVTTNLSSSAWTIQQGTIAGTGGPVQVAEPAGNAQAQGLYRVAVLVP